MIIIVKTPGSQMGSPAAAAGGREARGGGTNKQTNKALGRYVRALALHTGRLVAFVFQAEVFESILPGWFLFCVGSPDSDLRRPQ